MGFAQRLHEIMKNHGISKYKLSKQLDVSPSTIANWLNGESKPNIGHIRRIAALFQVSTDFLLTGDTAAQQDAPFMKLEEALLDTFRKVETEDKIAILQFAGSLANNQEINKILEEIPREAGSYREAASYHKAATATFAESGRNRRNNEKVQLSSNDIRRLKALLEKYDGELDS